MVSDISSGENGISLILEPEKSNDPFIPSLKSSIAKTLKDTFGTDTVISQIEIRPKTIAGKQQNLYQNFSRH